MPVTALALRQQKAYQNTAAVPVLLEDLKIIAELDRVAEAESQRLRQKANTTTGFGGGSAILAFISFWGASVIGAYAVLVIIPLSWPQGCRHRLRHQRSLPQEEVGAIAR
ncbi:MAG: hypothetical protein ACFBSF_21945 [Leptolyngbyaceae cyanobacterium]